MSQTITDEDYLNTYRHRPNRPIAEKFWDYITSFSENFATEGGERLDAIATAFEYAGEKTSVYTPFQSGPVHALFAISYLVATSVWNLPEAMVSIYDRMEEGVGLTFSAESEDELGMAANNLIWSFIDLLTMKASLEYGAKAFSKTPSVSGFSISASESIALEGSSAISLGSLSLGESTGFFANVFRRMEKTQRREVNVDRMRLTGNKPEGWITRLKRFDDVTIGKERYSFWVEGEGDEMFFYLAREGHGLRDGLFTYDATISVERQIVAGEECMKITSAMTAKGLRGRGLYSALKKNALQYIEDNVDNYAKIIEQDIIDTNPIYREVVKSAETGASLMDNDKILRHFEYVSGKKITDIRGEGVITANGYEYHLVVSLENH